VILKAGCAVLCAPIAIKNIGAHPFGFAQGKLVTRPSMDASQTKTDGDLIQQRSAPKSVSAFV